MHVVPIVQAVALVRVATTVMVVALVVAPDVEAAVAAPVPAKSAAPDVLEDVPVRAAHTAPEVVRARVETIAPVDAQVHVDPPVRMVVVAPVPETLAGQAVPAAVTANAARIARVVVRVRAAIIVTVDAPVAAQGAVAVVVAPVLETHAAQVVLAGALASVEHFAQVVVRARVATVAPVDAPAIAAALVHMIAPELALGILVELDAQADVPVRAATPVHTVVQGVAVVVAAHAPEILAAPVARVAARVVVQARAA